MRSEKDFYAIIDEYPEYKRFVVMGKDELGFLYFSCSWLTSAGLCRDHDSRMKLCSNFPDKGLHFCGGKLPPECGFRMVEVRPFDRYLKDEMKGQVK